MGIVQSDQRDMRDATHPMMLAYRFTHDNGSIVADNDDDGEHGAGRVLAHLLEMFLKDGVKHRKKGSNKKRGKKGKAKKAKAAKNDVETGMFTEGQSDLPGVKGCIVVVSRWYGGTHLGPMRFKHISNCARQALARSVWEHREVR